MNLQNRLDEAFDEYGDRVQAISDEQWQKYVKPWLDKMDIGFSQVNGNYWLTTKNGDEYRPGSVRRGFDIFDLIEDDESEKVVGILETLVPGQAMINLANYMPPKYPKEKDGE